ncbi:MAG TPA: hypothetical protein DCX54_10840, partial [Flavobacteriales bacterium]|nr:hypothetical protein [Flavobacteriales bacterium]
MTKSKIIALVFLFASTTLLAQQNVISTYTIPSFTANNGTGGITFELTTTRNITIDEIASQVYSSGTSTYTLWYKVGSYYSFPTTPIVSAANGWVQLQTGTSATGTGSSGPAVPFATNLGLVLSPGVYGFHMTTSNIGYRTHTGPPDVFTDGTVTIKTGVGYGYGGGTTNAFHPRQFMGSITYTLPSAPNDAGVSAIVSPVSDCDGSLQDIKVEVTNFGINLINSMQIHWTLNSVLQTPVNWTGLLDTANGTFSDKDTVTLGNMTLAGGNSYNIVAWTEIPNNITDTVNGNDTSSVTIQGYNYPTVNLGLDTTTCPNDPITLDAGSGRDSVSWNTSATTQTIVASTAQTYMVTVWKNGCSGGDTINIGFFPAPPTVNLGNDTMICYGDSIILDATAPGVTYLWHDNTTGPTHVADTVGNYSVIIEDANTCKNTDDINVSLFSKPLISMNVIPRNTLCYGAPFEFRANSFTQGSTMYQWKINTVNSGAPTTNNKFNPSLMYGDSVNVELLTDVCSSTTFAVPSNYITMYLKPEPKLISGSTVTDTVLENTSKNYLVPVVQGSTFTWSAIGGTIGSPVGNAVKVDWGSALDTAKIMVTEKDAGNCSFTNVRNVVVISIVGVKDENNLIGIGYAYPNPANTTVTIPLVIDGNWDIDLSLYDMT